MSNFPSYQQQTFTIPAGSAVDWNRFGSSFGCMDATGPFFVKFDGQPRTQFAKGLSFEAPDTFSQIRLENRGDVAVTITVFVADGRLRDARVSLPANLVAFTGAARSLRSSKKDVDAASRVSIVAADPDRLEVMVTNMGADPVFLGDDEVAFMRGLPLAAGHTATLKTQAELFAYCQAAGTQTLAILETRK